MVLSIDHKYDHKYTIYIYFFLLCIFVLGVGISISERDNTKATDSEGISVKKTNKKTEAFPYIVEIITYMYNLCIQKCLKPHVRELK